MKDSNGSFLEVVIHQEDNEVNKSSDNNSNFEEDLIKQRDSDIENNNKINYYLNSDNFKNSNEYLSLFTNLYIFHNKFKLNIVRSFLFSFKNNFFY